MQTPDPPRPRPDLMTTKEAAKRLGISERFVRSLQHSGALPAVKIGRTTRFDPLDLEEFIRFRKSGPLSLETLETLREIERKTGTQLIDRNTNDLLSSVRIKYDGAGALRIEVDE